MNKQAAPDHHPQAEALPVLNAQVCGWQNRAVQSNTIKLLCRTGAGRVCKTALPRHCDSAVHKDSSCSCKETLAAAPQQQAYTIPLLHQQ